MNSNGKFLITSCKEVHFVAGPFMAEAYALRDGLSLAQFLGGNKFISSWITFNIQVIEQWWTVFFRLHHLQQSFTIIDSLHLGLDRPLLRIVIGRLMKLLMCLLGIALLITLIIFGMMIPLVFVLSKLINYVAVFF
jgi:hypothetical protein